MEKIHPFLALPFFTGHLLKILPTLREKSAEFSTGDDDIPFLKKLIILSPETGFNYSTDLSEEDDDIKPVGTVGKTTVYEVSDHRDRERVFHFMAEFCVSDDTPFSQVSRFDERMRDILAHPERTCKDCLAFVYAPCFAHPRLSLVLCDIIEKELE